MQIEELLNIAKKAAVLAGEEILKIYNSEDFFIEYKDDKSPLTIADKKANAIIEKYLIKTKIPILSEEGKHSDYRERKRWNKLWIVDPLDGTKEFIKRNGEFTVNIALIQDDSPILGVIYVPVKKILYFASEKGAFKKSGDIIQKLPVNKKKKKYVAVGSRSHMSEETQDFFDKLKENHGEIEIVSMGSSLKICLVAEGIADVYPRFAPTMEWDTAAGHAIAKFAGKKFIDYSTMQEMKYNREKLLNSWFIVS